MLLVTGWSVGQGVVGAVLSVGVLLLDHVDNRSGVTDPAGLQQVLVAQRVLLSHLPAPQLASNSATPRGREDLPGTSIPW